MVEDEVSGPRIKGHFIQNKSNQGVVRGVHAQPYEDQACSISGGWSSTPWAQLVSQQLHTAGALE